MLYYLAEYRDIFGPLRLFEYVTFRAGGAALTAMLICFLLGPITVRLLKKLGATAPTRLEGLVDEEFIDRSKDKTPSMGGLLIIFSIAISTILWATPSDPIVFVFLATLLSLGGVGFLDDYAKVVHSNRDGISGRVKLLFQLIIALAAVLSLFCMPETGDYINKLMLPFMKNPLDIGWIGPGVVFIIGTVAVVGSSNAVNLTDGKDGLAIGCIIFCALTYAAFAYLCGHVFFAEHLNIPFIPASSEVVIFAAALVGSGIGFLWYNCHPASMFMGDTGSLALGGSIALIAVLVKQELTLLIVGGVFVMEAVSVMLQIASFKLTGKRIFRCAPIHHHFEQKGWQETQIVVRFWILSGIFALIGLATLKLR